MQRVFSTERLVVFVTDGPQTELFSAPRQQFLAYLRLEDRPMLVGNVLVSDIPTIGRYVDWIEISSEYRREGYATELMDGLTDHIGDLELESGSELGQLFLATYAPE